MMSSGYWQRKVGMPLRSSVRAIAFAVLFPSAVLASPPATPAGDLDLLATLRADPNTYDCDLRIADFEPPGGEEYLTNCVERLEKYLDDELGYCQWAGLLASSHQRSAEGGGNFTPEDRNALLQEAEQKGCKPRAEGGKATPVERVAKRWRSATAKFADLGNGPIPPAQLAKCVDIGYDSGKYGEVNAEGLYRLVQRGRLHDAVLQQAAEYFLVPVSATASPIEEVEDWKLCAKQSTPFGREVQTPSGSRAIENIINAFILVGGDKAFSDLPAGTKSHDFEGYFLYSRQILTSDDVTTTVVLARRPEFDSLVEKVRGLLTDYARIREFRTQELAKRPLAYAEAEFTAENLFAEAATISQAQADSEKRLEALQQHFGAPVGRRTRTQEWKSISWTGPVTALTENLEAELRLDSGIAGAPLHRLVLDARGTPLGEAACRGELKLGQTVTVVAKVQKLECDGTPETGVLRFTLEPLLAAERTAVEATTETNKEKEKDNKEKDKKGGAKPKPDQKPRQPKGVAPGEKIG